MNQQPNPGSDARDAGDSPARGDSPERSTISDDSYAFGAGLSSEASSSGKEGGARRKRSTKRSTKRKSTRTAKASGDDSDGDAGEERSSRRTASRKSTADKAASDGRASLDDDSGEERPARKKRKRTRRKSSSSEESSERGSADSGEASESEARPAARRVKRSRRKAASSEDSGEETPRDAAPEGDGEDSEEGGRRRRRRGTRGGRRKKKAREAAAVELIPGEDDDLPAPEPSSEGDGDGEREEGGSKKKRRRRKKKSSKAEGEAGEESGEEERSSSKKKAKKRRRKRSGSDADEDAGEDSGEGAERSKKKRGRRSKKKSDGDSSAAAKAPAKAPAKAEVKRDQVILVNAVDVEEKRVAVVDDGKIVDFLMNAESQKTLVNDIYRGKIVNLEPAIGAAFVDFGQGRNGFLHTSDVLAVYGEDGFKLDQLLTAEADPDDWDEDTDDDLDDADEESEEKSEKGSSKKKGKSSKKAKSRGRGKGGERRRARQRLPITDLVNLGDQVVVQITKDAIGDKGPTLTTYISIPGRYLVLMPSMARTGVSRKIPDDKERRRLKRILASLDVPANMGVIVRTAGIGKTKTDLKRDLEYLLGVWETFGKRLKQGRGPVPLYQESELSIRTMRDLFGPRTEAVIVDDPMVHEQLVEFAERLMPEHVERIKLHDGSKPLFHHHGLEQEFERIFARRVDLPSGGSIVFDQTEALVAIDVNSGRTRSDGFDFEEIALKTNLEAVPEIARQIRLRDLGGIIVCDFIDMMKSSSMRAVERALRAELSEDRARSKLGRISQFGLLEMTRQRLGPGTHKKVFQACPRCRGTARIRTVPSRAAAILRRLGSAMTQKGFTQVEVRAHPEVVDYLQDSLDDYVRALEHRSERTIKFTAVPDQPEDSVLRYLRADGREVRPGGRRKR